VQRQSIVSRRQTPRVFRGVQIADNDHRSSIAIFGIGSNADPTADVLSYAQQMVAHLTPGNDKFVFVTPCQAN
jgi:hypothetical protein